MADAAKTLVGTRFLLHGRDPAIGLDCVGVLAVCLAAAGVPAALPDRYTLRTRMPRELAPLALACGLEPAEPPWRAGDVALVRIGPCQVHLLVALDPSRFIHAHAGLRRVVVHFGPLGWAVLEHWRLRTPS